MIGNIFLILFAILLIMKGRLPYGWWSDTQWFIVHPVWARIAGVLWIIGVVFDMVNLGAIIHLPAIIFWSGVISVAIGVVAELFRLGARSNDPNVAQQIIDDYRKEKDGN